MQIECLAKDHAALGVPTGTDGLPVQVVLLCDRGVDKMTWSVVAAGVTGAFKIELETAPSTDGPWISVASCSDAVDGSYQVQVDKMPLARVKVTTLAAAASFRSFIAI
jgi:hypothetical protein